MIRLIGAIIGFGFAVAVLFAFGSDLTTYFKSPAEASVESEFRREHREIALSSDGPLGKYDRQQLQRGFQVYKEVCSACHSMTRVAFRDLAALGYSEAEVKAIANQWATEVPSVNPETGEAATRKAIPSDHFPAPYANETAARAANNNALPPDLSLMAKAREGGPEYIYSLLTGYRKQEGYRNEKGEELLKKFPSAKTPTGLYFNPWFANLNIAMPPPLTSDGQVTYAEGNPKPTVDQMAKDVSAFLVWTAEPKLENRHRFGVATIVFLLVATVLGYFSYQNIWAEAKRKVAPVGPLDPVNKARRTRATKKAASK